MGDLLCTEITGTRMIPEELPNVISLFSDGPLTSTQWKRLEV